jgi:hypothetical protein
MLPLCGLAPAALHAVVEQTMAPLFDAAICPRSTSSSSPGNLGARLLHVAGHPGVEYGGAAVRLQMAVEMVAYTAALTPIASTEGGAAASPTAETSRCLYVYALTGVWVEGSHQQARHRYLKPAPHQAGPMLWHHYLLCLSGCVAVSYVCRLRNGDTCCEQ